MQEFAEQNCAVFDGAEEEHSLEQTDIHERFKTLFERLVEEYIESLGVSIGEFYQMVAEDTHLTRVSMGRHETQGLKCCKVESSTLYVVSYTRSPCLSRWTWTMPCPCTSSAPSRKVSS